MFSRTQRTFGAPIRSAGLAALVATGLLAACGSTHPIAVRAGRTDLSALAAASSRPTAASTTAAPATVVTVAPTTALPASTTSATTVAVTSATVPPATAAPATPATAAPAPAPVSAAPAPDTTRKAVPKPTTAPRPVAPTSAPTPVPAPAPTPTAAPAPPALSYSPGPAGAAAQVIALTNQQRAAAGFGPLSTDGRLTAAAQRSSNDQAAHHHMSHDGSDGSTVATRATAAGYHWQIIGENVAVGYGSASSVMTGWMNSEGHRANILNPQFKNIGVSVTAAADGTLFWTMVLGG